MDTLRKAALAALVPTLTLLIAAMSHSQVRAQLTGNQVNFKVTGASSRMEMIVSTSRILTMDYKVPKMLVQNPEILTATPISPTQIQISAQAPGVTHLNLWDEQGQVYTVDVLISPDGRELEQLLALEFPDAKLRVRPLANSVVISGYVPSANMVSRVQAMAEDYYPNVINNIEVGGVQTVLLHTKVIEVSRTKLRQAGVDWALQTSSFNGASTVTGLLQSVGGAVATSGAETFAYTVVDGARTLNSAIQFMQQKNLAKILAEPTLTTVSGRPASFQSGGEFPIPVPQQNGVTSIEFREFGTRVDYVPIVLGNGTIRLEVRPSVTEIDASRSVSIGGTTIPGLRSRWVDTAVEMKAGQTLALAGLIQTRTEAIKRGIPHLSDMPFLGVPFRRVEHSTNEVEMLVMVTPEFVDGLDAHEVPQCLPGNNTTIPNDHELYCRGYLEVPNCKCMGAGCENCQHGGAHHGAPIMQHHAPATSYPVEPVPAPQQSAPIVEPPQEPVGPSVQHVPLGRRPVHGRTASVEQPQGLRMAKRETAPKPLSTPRSSTRKVQLATATAKSTVQPPRQSLPPIVQPLNPQKQQTRANSSDRTSLKIRMPQQRTQTRANQSSSNDPPEPGLIGPSGYERIK